MTNGNENQSTYRSNPSPVGPESGSVPAPNYGNSAPRALREQRTFNPDKLFGGFNSQDMYAGVAVAVMILGPLLMAPHH